jgi:RNA polymerase sporulation-specific sigma factor
MYFRGTKKSANDISLSDSIDTDREGNSLSLMDVICVDEDMFEDLAGRELCGMLRSRVELLEPREREIINLRYGLNGGQPLPQREVAKKLGISRSYVSRIEKKAIERLRELLE